MGRVASANKVIVNYAQVQGCLGAMTESVGDVPRPPSPPDVRESARMASTLARVQTILQDCQTRPDVLSSPEDRTAALLQSFIAERAVDEGKLQPLPATGDGAFEARFDENDWLGWAGSFFTWAKGIIPHVWIPMPNTPDPLPNTARIAVLGDWGTGLYGAPVCAASIEKDPRPLTLLLHLGDVYYSGTAREVGERFLAFWPQRTDAISRAVNSNHEMYTGGYGYFDIALRVFRQRSSVFAFMNDDWLLVGLDTAYADHDLAEGQAAWLEALVQRAAGRRLILFSHHQPFSLFERGGERLQAKLAPLLTQRRVFAWYWGHEHRCVLYEDEPASGLHGRCVGHSGYPYFRQDFGDRPVERAPDGHSFRRFGPRNGAPAGAVLDGPNQYIQGHENEYGPNGYITLELAGPTLRECLHAPDGAMLTEKTLE